MCLPLVDGLFPDVRLARGDDANNFAFGPVAMDDDEKPETLAQTEKNEALLVLGMVRVVNQQGMLIGEHGLRIFKGDAVLPEIDLGLLRIPLEPDD